MNLPSLHLSKRTKIILLSISIAAIWGSLLFAGYSYFRGQQIAGSSLPSSSSDQSSDQEPQEPEKAYEIIDNPDGSHTFVCYKFGFKFDYPRDWDFLESRSNLRGASGLDESGSVEFAPIYTEKRTYDLVTHIVVTGPRDPDIFPTLRDRLPEPTSEATAEPNATIGSVPAFTYPHFATQDRDTLTTVFETAEHVYIIYLPHDMRNDAEYLNVLNSFEFIE